jgi:glycerol uptake facilitator protein
MLGAFTGAAVVWLFYREHFAESQDPAASLACFSTAPNIRKMGQALFCEVVGTFALILPIFLITSAEMAMPTAVGGVTERVPVGLGSIGLIPVALLVFGIGLSLGGTTGYAINPARDLGPRLAHAILPVPGKRGSDWGYAWVPVAGPVLGALLAALTYGAIT